MKFSILLFSLFCSGLVAAQSISSYSFSATGGSFSDDENSVHFSMGEVLNTEISDDNLRLMQGLIQYLLTESPSGVASFQLEDIAIYPNPARNYITIQNDKTLHNLKYALYNIDGREIKSPRTLSQLKTTLVVESLPSGSYILKITKEDQYFQNLNLIKF